MEEQKKGATTRLTYSNSITQRSSSHRLRGDHNGFVCYPDATREDIGEEKEVANVFTKHAEAQCKVKQKKKAKMPKT